MYDSIGNVQTKTHKIYKGYYAGAVQTDDIGYSFSYSGDSKNRLTQMSVGSVTENYAYDSLERNKKISQTINGNIISKDYGYYKNGDHATSLVNSVFYKTNGAVTDREHYTYDNMGNVISISKNGIKQKEYKYDTLGRIIYENNLDTNREISYTYDRQGNILSKTDNGTKIEYTYDESGFKLLSFGGQSYNYDNLGNPLNINSTYYSASWTKAHLLTTLNASSHSVNFTYDSNGLMTRRTIGSQSTTYTYEEGKLVRLTDNGSYHTDFIYGKEGLIGFVKNGETYLYQKNIFGDIIKIINSAGVVVGEYSYTAFGECTIVTNVNNIASTNPFRYRGYFLESNSGLYYLKSRFYNPITGRFISPDDTKYLQPDTINGLNLYAYCLNNPIMCVDDNGNAFITLGALFIGGLVAAIVGAGVGVGTAAYNDYKEDGEWFNGDWSDYVGRAVGGLVAGFGLGVCGVLGAGIGAAALAGTTAALFTASGMTMTLGSSLLIGSGVAFLTGAAGYSIRVGISKKEKFSFDDMMIEGLFNALSGAVSVLGGTLGGGSGVHNSVLKGLSTNKDNFIMKTLLESGSGFLIKLLLSKYKSKALGGF